MLNNSITRILVVKYKNIGDILLSTSLLNELQAIFPLASIDYMLNGFCADVIRNHPSIRRVIPKTTLSMLTLCREKYDLAIFLSVGDRTPITAALTRAQLKIGFTPEKQWLGVLYDKHLPRKFSNTHTAVIDLQPLRLLGHTPGMAIVSSYWTPADEAVINKILSQHTVNHRKFIVIHPVARWQFKSWNNKYFSSVIDHVQQVIGLPVILTASNDPNEKKRTEIIAQGCQTKPLNLAGTLSLSELACLYSKAALFLGVDTAPMHIAASVNTPVIALFGSSEPAIWGPWDNKTAHQYSNEPTIQHSSLHTILQCGFGEIAYSQTGEKYNTALQQITPAMVLSELSKKL